MTAFDVFPYGHVSLVPRAATTSDAFNAVAEPRRRQIIELLARGERSVTSVALELGVTQPQASKHLRVLREVGLVNVRGVGQRRLYSLDREGLKPIHDWAATFEHLWQRRLDRLATYLDQLQGKEEPDEHPE